MIILCLSMQMEDVFLSILNGKCLHFSMQEEDTLKHSNGRCHLCTF